MAQIFIDGDFPTNKECEYHCSPSCHPMQIGPDWVFGCLHPAFPANKYGDFCPIVDCDGKHSKCELSKVLLGRWKGGLKRRINTAETKIKRWKKELGWLEKGD